MLFLKYIFLLLAFLTQKQNLIVKKKSPNFIILFVTNIISSSFIFLRFIYFLAVVGLRCCVSFSLVVANRGFSLVLMSSFSCCGAWPQWASLIVAPGLSNCGEQGGLSYMEACGIFPRDQGSNQCLLH